ncbi:RagB/SusD family nutrient uptake outer membrane protein [Pedobacter nyackensis]|uniref:SusD family protein n=1 Tax=Pedobacter nyackensis TaxID=475255 RepID=A0A1W2B5B2_9SPHI|nr:RagB/SusD family nutrient uptake outer membrane protein [Pedobacter nyackensis]SMC68116.1 SusD family protein [Pedobacter nyackensis]
MKFNYKNIIKVVVVLAVLAGTGTGCKKFLDSPPASKLPEEEALADEAGVRTILTGAYQIVGGDFMFGGRTKIMSELVADQLDGTQLSGDFGETFQRKSSIFGEYKRDLYTQSYQGIYRANTVLKYLDKVSPANRDNVEGQALFIRALIHFELVKLFGQPYGFNADNSQFGIPIRLTATAESKVRSTVKQVYDQIIADLKLAETKMLDNNAGFADKWAAKGLLAKVYFQMNDFPNAYNYANQVISTNKYLLDATYETRFSEGLSKESVFQIISTRGVYEAGGHLRDNMRSTFTVPTIRFTKATFDLVNTPNDIRKAFIDGVKYPGLYALTKYNKDRFNIPVVYLTELKLIRAESAAESNTNLDVAIKDVNDIMNRAYAGAKTIPLNSSAAFIITNARLERNLEFIGEGVRLSEIKRIGARGGENVDKRGSVWNCPGFILQFPQEEMATNLNFQRNPEGNCF